MTIIEINHNTNEVNLYSSEDNLNNDDPYTSLPYKGNMKVITGFLEELLNALEPISARLDKVDEDIRTTPDEW